MAQRLNENLDKQGRRAAKLEVLSESKGSDVELEVLHLTRNGWVPNNDQLPVVLYRAAISIIGADPASHFEERFERNGWPPQWRDSVYDFHHYHSTAHEVLGFARGYAKLILGARMGLRLWFALGMLPSHPPVRATARRRPALTFSLWARIRQVRLGTYAVALPRKKLSAEWSAYLSQIRTR
jgi:hypothetical protein